MYDRSLNITIFGEAERIKSVMEGVDQDSFPPYTLAQKQSVDPDLVEQADIVIVMGVEDFSAIREGLKVYSTFIACLTAEEEEELSEEEKGQLDDIWQMPISDYNLRLRLIHALVEVSNRHWSVFLMGCLDTFMNSMPDMVWFKDLDGIHRKVNDYFCEFVGKPREEVEGATHGEIWGLPATGEDVGCHDTDLAAVASGETVTAEEVVETDTGKRLFKTIKTPIRGLDGEILGTVGIGHDLTNMLNLNMELDLFLAMMPLPLMICDVEDRISKANASFLKFFETGMKDMLELDWRNWYEENILHEISPTGEDIYRRFRHGDGRVSFLKMISHEMNDTFGNYLGVIHVFEDVTADKELEYNIWKLANTDALTEIANRQAFYEYTKRINPSEKVHLFYIDLDNFKHVNDVYGHKAGDEALKATAGILREVFARDFPARLGGDEFLVCVRRPVSLEEIENMAQNLIDRMQEKFSGSEIFNRLSCSVGILMDGSMQDGIEPLIKLTDSAMYESKKRGKACYSIHQAQTESAQKSAAS